MNDIKQWLGRVEKVDPPDQWTEIDAWAGALRADRAGGPPRDPGPRGRRDAWKKVAIIVAALFLTALATGALVREFRSGRDQRPGEPPRTPMANGDIWVAQGTGESGYTIRRVDPSTGNGSILWADGRDPSVPGTKVDPARVGIDYAFSPDGSQVVFSHGGLPGATELFVMNTDSTGLRQLTHDGGADEWPAWSPDGRSIAYVDNRAARIAGCISPSDLCQAHLNVVDLASGIARRLTDAPVAQSGAGPSWSPDGTKLVFIGEAPDGSGMLEMVHADGTDLTEIRIDAGTFPFSPEWSPDGARILFLGLREGGTAHLWTIGPDGSDARDLLDTGADTNFGRPVWSPDSSEVAYARVVDAVPQLWLVRADGSDDRLLAPGNVARSGLAPLAWQPVPPDPQGLAEVPSVIGLPRSEGIDVLEAAGFELRRARTTESASPKGTVVSQFPPPGARVPAGSAVGLWIAKPIPGDALGRLDCPVGEQSSEYLYPEVQFGPSRAGAAEVVRQHLVGVFPTDVVKVTGVGEAGYRLAVLRASSVVARIHISDAGGRWYAEAFSRCASSGIRLPT